MLSNTQVPTPEASETFQKVNKVADFVGLSDWMTIFPFAKPEPGSTSVADIKALPDIIIMAMVKNFGVRCQSETSIALIYLTVAEVFQVNQNCDGMKVRNKV